MSSRGVANLLELILLKIYGIIIFMLSSPIEEIKNRLDIVEVVGSYIKLQKAGANYRALCPFHSEKKPSFFVSPARQIWHCFGACGTGGDIFKFVMQIEGVEFGDALRILAQKAGVELKREDPKLKTERQRLYEVCELACCFFEKQLEQSSMGKQAKKYLLSRGIKEESIKKWRLGYAPDIWQGLSDFLVGQGYKREEIMKAGLVLKSEKTGNYYDRFRGRIIFPIFNLSSQTVGFGGRIFKQIQRPDGQEEAKYINIPNTLLYDKSRILYGLNKAGMGTRKRNNCILVEGYVDAIMSSQAGFENVVATSGTALTNFQLKNLKRYSDNLLTAFDMDIAGNSATKRGIDLAQSLGFNIRVVTMPKGSDPADIVFQNPKDWENLVQKAKSIHDFYFENTLSKFDKDTLEGKKEISRVLLAVIKKIPNRIEKSFWIQDLAKVLEVKEEDVLEEFQKTTLHPAIAEGLEDNKETDKKIIPLPRKTRKELLEEQLIILVIKSPNSFDLIGKEDFKLFSPQTSQILAYFKKEGLPAASQKEAEKVNLTKSIPTELNDLINYLLLKVEAESFLDKDLGGRGIELNLDKKEEFKNCLREFKVLLVRDKLGEISKEIKKAEEEKDFNKVQNLIQKFNSYAKSRRDLELA